MAFGGGKFGTSFLRGMRGGLASRDILKTQFSKFAAGMNPWTNLKTLAKFDPASSAAAAAKLLGTATASTLAYRTIRGRAPFRDRKGKRDFLPWVPFI